MSFSRNSIRLRIVLPIFFLFTATSIALVLALLTASHAVSRRSYAYLSTQQADGIRSILDGAFTDLVNARLMDNPVVTDAKQRMTVEEIRDYLAERGLDGLVTRDGGETILSTIAPSLLPRVEPFLGTTGPFHVEKGLEHYNGFGLRYSAWGWNILLVQKPTVWVVEAYRGEFGYLMPVSALLGFALFGVTLLIFRRNFQRPVDRILSDLSENREIRKTGVSELDTIVDAVNRSLQQEKKLYEHLLRSQKLEAMGTLAGGVAHDFNNILTAIHGYAELLAEMPNDPEATVRYARTIHAAAAQGADLTRRILSTTRKERMEVGPVDLNEVVRGAMTLLERSIPKNIEVVANLDESIPFVLGDSSHLQQVIVNLAVNARDAMPAGGKLAIGTRRSDGEELPPGNRPPAKEGYVRLSLSDTGCGMDPETRRKVFDPFFTTKEAGKGTGLGLFIVHSVVVNHGGAINLYSEPGQGTHFSIYLPATAESRTEVHEIAADLSGSGTILVIDDESSILELCVDLLASLGYETITASSGEEGLARFAENRDRISLVLLDLIMPKMGGEAVFRALRAQKPDVKVLVSSGYTPDGYDGIDALIREGAAGFVPKPFSRRAIGLAIRDALARDAQGQA